MNWIKKLFGAETNKRQNVVLLVKVRRADDTIDESRHVVHHNLIQNACETACTHPGAVEVWVYQKIFHHSCIASEGSPVQKAIDEPFDILGAALSIPIAK